MMGDGGANSPLYLLQVDLDTPGLIAMGMRTGLPMRDADVSYLAHGALTGLFGRGVVKPFAIAAQEQRSTRVLGYSESSAEELRVVAETAADPEIRQVAHMDSMRGKEMPSVWPKGATLRFDARICPVIRKSSGGERHAKGAEVDAFLDRCWEVGSETVVSREQVYREWLEREFERRGGAQIESVALQSFQLAKQLRRTQGDNRVGRSVVRPVATMEGVLRVTDGTAFDSLLRRGFGRHRAFGFGMLLLRRA